MTETPGLKGHDQDPQAAFVRFCNLAARLAISGTMPLDQLGTLARQYLSPGDVEAFMRIATETYAPLMAVPQVEEL